MRKVLSALLVLLYPGLVWPQAKLSVHWEELTADEFRSAIEQSRGTCLLPFGILEKHGQHLPLGTDLLKIRYAALHAAEQEIEETGARRARQGKQGRGRESARGGDAPRPRPLAMRTHHGHTSQPSPVGARSRLEWFPLSPPR